MTIEEANSILFAAGATSVAIRTLYLTKPDYPTREQYIVVATYPCDDSFIPETQPRSAFCDTLAEAIAQVMP